VAVRGTRILVRPLSASATGDRVAGASPERSSGMGESAPPLDFDVPQS